MTAEETSAPKGTPDNQLAMSRMKEEIEAIAKKEAQDMINEAKERAKEITAEAKKEAESIKKDIVNAAKDDAQKEKVRQVSRKKLNIKMDYLETREAIIDEIIVEARSELQKFTKSKEYPDFLHDLVKSSGISIGGGDLVLHLRAEDKSHITKESLNNLSKEISETTGLDTSISVADGNLNALGGIKVVRADNKLFVDNTFESRLERSDEDIRHEIMKLLS